MSNPLYRKEIAKEVYFSKITDDRYKFNLISINFYSVIDKDKVTANSLIPQLLSKNNSKYPTNKEFSNLLARMYAASINDSSTTVGDLQQLAIEAVCLDDKYALNGEKLTEGITEILLDCLLSPVTQNGTFPQKAFETERNVLIEDIESIINDKRIYAMAQALKTVCKDEPRAFWNETEKAKELTPDIVYNAYKHMLSSYRCEIFCVGCNDFSAVEEKLTSAFSKIERADIEQCVTNKSALKTEPQYVTELMDVNQSKMVIGYKVDSDDNIGTLVMNHIYGGPGAVTSKLFTIVREKMSLCYYCSGPFNTSKKFVVVNCGVESDNIEKARDEIIYQLDEVKAGNVSEKELEQAKKAMVNARRSVRDGVGSMVRWYLPLIMTGDDIHSPEDEIEEIMSVDLKRVIENANKVTLDTVYVLTSEKKEEE